MRYFLLTASSPILEKIGDLCEAHRSIALIAHETQAATLNKGGSTILVEAADDANATRFIGFVQNEGAAAQEISNFKEEDEELSTTHPGLEGMSWQGSR